jgi:superfamily II DNA or RNA helicase
MSGGTIRQLIEPQTVTSIDTDTAGTRSVKTVRRTWPVIEQSDGTLAPGAPDGPVLVRSQDAAGVSTLAWTGPAPALADPAEVLEGVAGRFQFVEGTVDGSRAGLRRPQIGAVHAVLGYWTTAPVQPATVVMPTGTGKTDTMIAVLAAGELQRLLVVVPTDALRTQLARKFQTWGLLPKAGVLPGAIRFPVVGTVEHAFASTAEAVSFAERCNVIVTTVAALSKSDEAARRALVGECSHLFVDEAHHVAAASWDRIRNYFEDQSVVQFTATPFRADGRHLGGRLTYAFPLREAQRLGYFSRIDYIPVTDFAEPDRAIARTAVERLRADVEAGLDHLLMARVNTIKRAEEVFAIYQDLAPDLAPVMVHSRVPGGLRRDGLRAVEQRTSRIVVCVDMLGEGYDLPALKVAAIHDAHKTLPVTLQFLGRFTRAESDRLGDACVVVNRPAPDYDETLRDLYADDADWNLVIRELAQNAVGAEQRTSDFEAGFGFLPEEVPIRALEPKMSTVAYRTQCTDWSPLAVHDIFPEQALLTPTVAVNREHNVAWFVTEERTPVQWGNLNTVEEIVYNLYVLYWDRGRQLLYINSSNTASVHRQLAEAVAGDTATIINGEHVYRVMAEVHRLVPTNVGLLDVRSRARRFSMHVGADVTEGFPTVEAQTKAKTNIFAYGYENGARVGVGGSLKGRVWSNRAAHSLGEWRDWCDAVGAKLVDDTASVDDVMRGFIRPKIINERPDLVLIGVDWPHEVYLNTSDETMLTFGGEKARLLDTELRVVSHQTHGPVEFEIVTATWTASYTATFTDKGIVYQPTQQQVHVAAPRSEYPLTRLLERDGLTMYFEDETTVERGGLLLRPDRTIEPFPTNKLTPVDWMGVDIKKESQGRDRDPASIQHRMIQRVIAERDWDVVIDDDGAGEAADIVAIATDAVGMLIKLVHCKYSSENTPGARVADLYELCGQAHKSNVWKNAPRLLDHLVRRERDRRTNHHHSGFELGDDITLRSLQHRARAVRARLEVTVVQPGLSAAKVSPAQLQLLACAETYLYETATAPLEVICSR